MGKWHNTETCGRERLTNQHSSKEREDPSAHRHGCCDAMRCGRSRTLNRWLESGNGKWNGRVPWAGFIEGAETEAEHAARRCHRDDVATCGARRYWAPLPFVFYFGSGPRRSSSPFRLAGSSGPARAAWRTGFQPSPAQPAITYARN